MLHQEQEDAHHYHELEAVLEVLAHEEVEVFGVALEAAVNGVTGSLGPIGSRLQTGLDGVRVAAALGVIGARRRGRQKAQRRDGEELQHNELYGMGRKIRHGVIIFEHLRQVRA